jgi:hypothetical protein
MHDSTSLVAAHSFSDNWIKVMRNPLELDENGTYVSGSTSGVHPHPVKISSQEPKDGAGRFAIIRTSSQILLKSIFHENRENGS